MISHRRRKRSALETEILREQIEDYLEYDKRRRKLYNRRFRKGYFYISAWVVRIVFMGLFLFATFFHDKPSSYRKEIVISKKIEKRVVASRRSGLKSLITTLYLETNYDNYSSDINKMRPIIEIGDTIIIERNILNKPIYFREMDWPYKFGIIVYCPFYFMVFLTTLISLSFIDGLNRFTINLLSALIVIDLAAIICYFLC